MHSGQASRVVLRTTQEDLQNGPIEGLSSCEDSQIHCHCDCATPDHVLSQHLHERFFGTGGNETTSPQAAAD